MHEGLTTYLEGYDELLLIKDQSLHHHAQFTQGLQGARQESGRRFVPISYLHEEGPAKIGVITVDHVTFHPEPGDKCEFMVVGFVPVPLRDIGGAFRERDWPGSSDDCFYVEMWHKHRTGIFGQVRLAEIHQGAHIGSYMLGLLVEWGHRYFPNYRVAPVFVGPADAEDPINRVRRNRLYTTVGMNYAGGDPKEKRYGYFVADSFSQLAAHEPKVTEINLVIELSRLIKDNESTGWDVQLKNRLLDDRLAQVDQLQREKWLLTRVTFLLSLAVGILLYWCIRF